MAKAPKSTRAIKFGEIAADAVIEAAHLTYNAFRGRAMVKACIRRLKGRLHEITPRQASAIYRKARYGS